MSCGKQEEEDQGYQEQILIQQQMIMQQQQQQQQMNNFFGGSSRGGGFVFPEVSPNMLPWSSFSSVNTSFSPGAHVDPAAFLVPPPPAPPPPPPSSYGGLFNRRQFAYDQYHHGSSSVDHLRMLSETLGLGAVVQPGELGLGKMSAQEIMDAKALAASKSHSEAERRRRERINNHLAKLRSLLPSTTKTDKASLLAEVIQHVRELKRQTSLIAETSPVPTEMDEVSVEDEDENGKFVIKASICCEDRSDLLPELIKTLKALRLKTVKAEITTLGGRIKNVLFITGEQHQYCIGSIQEALKAVMDKTSASGDQQSSSGTVKRQRTNITII